MRKTVVLGAIFLAAVVALVVWTSTGVGRYRCEVCVSHEGSTACRIAAAGSRDEALRAATVNACAQVAAGVTASIQCESAPPASVRWIQ